MPPAAFASWMVRDAAGMAGVFVAPPLVAAEV